MTIFAKISGSLNNYLNGFFDLRISILFEIFLVKNSNIFLYFSAPGERYILLIYFDID